jgi:hypothetical protein
MKIKALISVIGKYNINAGDVVEIDDKAVLKDLLKLGYVEEVKEEKKTRKKKVTTNENE